MLEEVDQSVESNDLKEEEPPKSKKRFYLEISLKVDTPPITSFFISTGR